ncbi:MAG: penicillin-binding protein 1A, partial [Caulobacteraceae bacterium]
MANAAGPEATPGPRPPKGGGGGPRKPRRTPLQALLYWSLVAGVWGVIFVTAFLVVFARGLPDTSRLYEIQRQPSITYLDRSGVLIATRGSQYAPPVDIDHLPTYVPAAFVAIEDRRFYSHIGFDPVGMVRMVIVDLRERRYAQGASTITQQLARNLFLTPDQKVRRKIQELMLAVWLEWKFSKKQILALYMNRVYFGAGAYGIEAAAQRFFNKPASQLSVGEAALLAGLLKSPTHYSPVSETTRAERRATIVLDKMVEIHAISPAQRDEAFEHPVQVSKSLSSQHAQYFADWVDGQVRQLVGQPQTDLVVETTLDLSINSIAEAAARSVAGKAKSRGVEQAAIVALDGAGRVRAMVGGVDYGESQFNRAVTAKRQAGSSFKPFVYLTAMEAGHTPDEVVVDEPLTIGNWSPKNYTGRYLGPITIATAVAQSINTVAARMADLVGRDNVAKTARRLGIVSPVGTDPSMALGAVEVSPLEMAQAYAPFSNGGHLAMSYGIERIRTADGKVLYENRSGARTNVIGNPALTYMNQMLRGVIHGGTGGRAAVPGYDIAGKTGTTSDYKDAWFVGYTGGFVAAVWTGKDNNTPMAKVTGGGEPAEIWRAFMAATLPRLQVQTIPGGPAPPPGVVYGDPIGDALSNAVESGNEVTPPDEAPPGASPGTAPPL